MTFIAASMSPQPRYDGICASLRKAVGNARAIAVQGFILDNAASIESAEG